MRRWRFKFGLAAHERSNPILDTSLTFEKETLRQFGLSVVPIRDEKMLRAELQDILSPSDTTNSMGRIDHFEVLQILGAGGSGLVVKAIDTKLERIVALKILNADLAAKASYRTLFVHEARLAAKISHPNLVAIHSVQDEGIRPYIVMEYFKAVSLQQYLEETKPVDIGVAVEIATKICEGLGQVHRSGIHHGDLKPANILIHPQSRTVKLTDFGIAGVTGKSTDQLHAHRGLVRGTPRYMSPEQASGKSLNSQSDLFSLGSVLYVILTGKSPFTADDSSVVLTKIVTTTPTPVNKLRADVPQSLVAIVSKLHASRLEDRFQSTEEILQALSRVNKRDFWSSRHTSLIIVLLSMFAVCAFAAFLLSQQPTANDQNIRDAAQKLLDGGAMLVVAHTGVHEEIYVRKPDVLPLGDIDVHGICFGEFGSWTGDVDFGFLKIFPDLWMLELASTNTNDKDLSKLLELPRLRHLGLAGTEVTDNGMTTIASIDALLTLSLDYAAVTDEGIEKLMVLRQLESFSVAGPQITDDTATLIAAFPGLFSFSAIETKITDEGIHRLLAKKQWHSLVLTGSHITDHGIAMLSELQSLNCLYVEGVRAITDASVDDLLRMSQLRDLNVSGTGITEEGFRLLQANPNLQVLGPIK